MVKPDDRSDNVEKLQDMIGDTMENMDDARDFLKAHGDEMRTEDRENIKDKNGRRARAIDGFREEIRDEVEHQRH